MDRNKQHWDSLLYQELMLQVNQRLYSQGIIPKGLYEQAKTKIIETVLP